MSRLELELGVLGSLLASFLRIPLPVPHLVLGMTWAMLAVVHVVRRRRVYLAVLRRGFRLRAATTTALIASAPVATVSGAVQWAGFAAAIPWHAGSSILLLLLADGHAGRRLWSHLWGTVA